MCLKIRQGKYSGLDSNAIIYHCISLYISIN
jgi:hypothetical protein